MLDERWQKELELETGSVEEGLAYFRKKQAGYRPAETKVGQDFLRQFFDMLEGAIRQQQELIMNAQSHPKLLKHDVPLLSLESEKLAVITLRAMFNFTATKASPQSGRKLASVAREIGTVSYLERSFDVQRGIERQVDDLLGRRNRNRWNATRRARKLALIADEDWSEDDRGIRLGLELLNLATKHLLFLGQPAFEVAGTAAVLTFSREFAQWLRRRDLHHEQWARPAYLPMVVRPRPWTALKEGGYLTIKTIGLVKRGRTFSATNVLASANLPTVFESVNALQATAWRINNDVYRIMLEAWERGFPFPGEFAVQPLELPVRVPEDCPPEELKGHKAERARIHQHNFVVASNRQLMNTRFEWCHRLVNEAPLYFPYQLDNRGRLYPVPHVFHPQADDVGRALLTFHDGKALGPRGVHWLAIHLANLFGYDKFAFADRIAWVYDHEAEIMECAAKPLDDARLWLRADRPWCFLAACIEWSSFRSHGPEFRSHIPVSMDGTCNGLQHLSALGRDCAGGESTNLVPAMVPRDIYAEVASIAQKQIRINQQNGLMKDLPWTAIDRTVVKRATMTTPYGVTRRGIRNQLINDEHLARLFGESPKWKTAHDLAGILQEAIASVVVKGVEIMKWLKALTRALAKHDRFLIWTLPSGFIASNEYRRPRERRIVTSERTLVIYVDDPNAALNVRKQVNAVAPNVIHSFDAAHMMLTVIGLVRAGLSHFAMVHDSYAVHACDIDVMNRVLREQFVNIYCAPVLDTFFEEQCRLNPDLVSSLPFPPAVGMLRVEDVLASDYFFS